MRRLRGSRVTLLALVFISTVVAAGCENLAETSTTGASSSVATSTTATGTSAEVTTGAGTTASSAVTPTTAPLETPNSTAGAFPAITPEEIINLVAAYGMYSSQAQIEVFDHRTFGDLAGAYVWAEGDDVYLVVFSWQSGGWMIMDHMNGPWEDMLPRLQFFNAPQEFLDWAYPEGD